MAGPVQGPTGQGPTGQGPTGRRRRRAVGPASSVRPTAGSPEPEPAARELGWGEAHEGTGTDDDERLLREVPPHHGD